MRDARLPSALLAMSASVLAVSIAVASGVRADRTGVPEAAMAGQQTPPGASGASAQRAQTDEDLAKVGEDLVNRICSTSCHGLEKLDEMRRTSRDWNDEVDTMAGKGAMATDAQFGTIKKYLTRYYGVVMVNTATAAELSAVVGFSARDAEAIVAYRTAHGRFADANALARVPGIDTTRITEQPDALNFK